MHFINKSTYKIEHSKKFLKFIFIRWGLKFIIASIHDFNAVIVLPLITCPRNLSRVRKSVIYLGLLSCFLLVKSGCRCFSYTLNNFFFVCDCIRTSSKLVITFLLRISGLKILLIKTEKLLILWKFHRRVY